MARIARNLSDAAEADRDPLYNGAFIDRIAGCGIEAIKLPPEPPNLNPYAESFVAKYQRNVFGPHGVVR
jgi:hypothetical protein